MTLCLHNRSKRLTRSIVRCSLVLLVGLVLLQVVNADDQRLLADDGDLTSGPIIGINIGTKYSRVSSMRDGKIEILSDDNGSYVTPSWVGYTEEELLVDTAAKDWSSNNLRCTVHDIKRFFDREYNDESMDRAIQRVPFKIMSMRGQSQVSIKLQGKQSTCSPEEFLSIILRKLKGVAEKRLGELVHRAVVAVPAHFNDAQRSAVKNAGRIAGLEILRIVNEPTAAALAYRLDETNQTNAEITTFGLERYEYVHVRNILVYDLGADTIDVSVITIEDGVFEILSTAGKSYLGGESFNNRVLDYITKRYSKYHNIDITHNSKTMEELEREIEKAKRALSSEQATTVRVKPYPHKEYLVETLNRSEFEALNNDLFEETFQYVERALRSANMTEGDIDDVVLAGGSSHIPRIQQMHKDIFGERVRKHINPEEVIAVGGALQGSLLAEYSGMDGPCLILDITPSSLGVEVTDGIVVPFIKRGANYPTKKSRIFSTKSDNQSTFSVRIFEGERFKTTDNHKLGEFELDNIPMALRGIPQIEITFELDHNEILKVSALDKSSGRNNSIIILKQRRLSAQDLDRMYEDIEVYEEEDKINRARYESRAAFEHYVHSLKRQIYVHDGVDCRIKEDSRGYLADAVQNAEDWLDANGATAALSDFTKRCQNLSVTVDIITSTDNRCNWWNWCHWWRWKSCALDNFNGYTSFGKYL